MKKNWIVVELDRYNDEGIGRFSNATGPFTEEQAKAKAGTLTALNHYATEYYAVKLAPKHWAEM